MTASKSASAESNLSCYYEDVYEMWYLVDYYCVLNIDNENANDDFANISGAHPGNLTDSDVRSVYGMAAREDSVKIVPRIICEKFVNLEKLWLDDLAITTVTDKSFSACGNLEDLYLGFNHITSLPWNAFNENLKLRILDLGHNRFENLHVNLFRMLTSLEELHLDYNQLVHLEGFEFIGVPQLRKLNLEGNQIIEIGEGAFHSFVNLEVLEVNR